MTPLVDLVRSRDLWSKDYERVVADVRLANGLPWSIPITLSVEEAIADPQGRQLDTPRCSQVGFVGVCI